MRKSSRFSRVTFVAVATGTSILLACTERPASVTGLPVRAQFGGGNGDDIRAAIAAQVTAESGCSYSSGRFSGVTVATTNPGDQQVIVGVVALTT